MTGRVIVVGSVNVDLVVRTARLPRPGETVSGGEFARHDGGKGGNQAVAAARLGAATTLVGAVGDDELGNRARAALEDDGVSTAELVTAPGASTGVAVIVVDAAGENLIAVAPGANALVTPELVASAFDRLAPRPGDVILAGHEVPTAAAREALRLGRAAGATTILNPAPAAGIDRSMLALVDVLTPNQGELTELLGREAPWTGASPADHATAPHEAAALLDAGHDAPGAGAVLVSLGAAGAVLVRPDVPPLAIAAPRVDAVDATGAGDALNGALAAQLAAGRELTEAATRAVLAATSSTRRAGARDGLIDAVELDRLAAQPRPADQRSPGP